MKKVFILFLLNFYITLICYGQNSQTTQNDTNAHGVSGGGLILLIVLAWLLLRKSSSEIKYRCENPKCRTLTSKKSWERSGCCPRCHTEFYTQVK